MTPWGEEQNADSSLLLGRTVLQLLPALDEGPEAFACVEAAAALNEAGARALVAGSEGAMVSELQARGGVFLPFDLTARNPLTAMLNRGRLADLAEREGAELIHLRGGAGFPLALHAARKNRIPLVVEDFGPASLEANTIIFNSDTALQAAKASHPHLAGRFAPGLRGVDLRGFSPDAVEPARVAKLRAAWGVRPHERMVVGIGLPADRQKFFLLAAAQLAKKNFFDNEAQEVRFIWRDAEGASLTSGPFEAQAREMGLDRHVFRVAGGDKAAACVGAALVAVPAADSRLAIEAQALGAPVALVQSAASQNVDDVVGWVIAADAPSAFARAAEEALRLGASARERLSARAREHARAFSAESMSALTLAAYARHFAGT